MFGLFLLIPNGVVFSVFVFVDMTKKAEVSIGAHPTMLPILLLHLLLLDLLLPLLLPQLLNIFNNSLLCMTGAGVSLERRTVLNL